jgi:hypothetical protein
MEKIGIVAVFDALGVSSLSMDECKKFLNGRKKVLEAIDANNEIIVRAAKKQGSPWKKSVLVTFGDTLVLSWEISENAMTLLPAFGIALRAIIGSGLRNRLLLRGAFSLGEYIQDEDGSTLLGPAVADAAYWHDKADWIGAVATPSTGNKLAFLESEARAMGTTEELAMAGSYVPYMVPLNSSEDRELWAVSWPVQLLRLTPDKNIDPESAFKFLMAQFQVPPGTEDKYKNTIEFFEWYRKKYYSDNDS